MNQALTIKILKGDVTVAYRRHGRGWRCTALEFDLVGVGNTQEKAFAQLRDLVNGYLDDVLNTDGPVRFFNPSDAEEWDSPKKEKYRVEVVVSQSAKGAAGSAVIPDIDKLRSYRSRIRAIDLTPLGV
jgi:hypothetical protein